MELSYLKLKQYEAKRKVFVEKLAKLINEFSLENGSDTPDFILADYLADCLVSFNVTLQERKKWYGGDKSK